MILIAKCGKTSEVAGNHCYGHACLDYHASKCNVGRALVRDKPQDSPNKICYEHLAEERSKTAEVICKELGFPVNAPFTPTTSSTEG